MNKSSLRENFESVLIAAILALFIRTFVFQAFKIPTGSMENNLLVGDHILVNKFIYGPTLDGKSTWGVAARDIERHDVVVFRAPQEPDKDFIKRVIGLPGEQVEVREGIVYIDGDPLDEPYAFHSAAYGFHSDTAGPIAVPEDNYFCLGDNRDNSRDSRYWGSVPRRLIKGKAMLVYWSFEAPNRTYFTNGVGEQILKMGRIFVDLFTQTRWDRFFHLIR